MSCYEQEVVVSRYKQKLVDSDYVQKNYLIAHRIYKLLKACRFNKNELLKRFDLSEDEKERFNRIYGKRLGKL